MSLVALRPRHEFKLVVQVSILIRAFARRQHLPLRPGAVSAFPTSVFATSSGVPISRALALRRVHIQRRALQRFDDILVHRLLAVHRNLLPPHRVQNSYPSRVSFVAFMPLIASAGRAIVIVIAALAHAIATACSRRVVVVEDATASRSTSSRRASCRARVVVLDRRVLPPRVGVDVIIVVVIVVVVVANMARARRRRRRRGVSLVVPPSIGATSRERVQRGSVVSPDS